VSVLVEIRVYDVCNMCVCVRLCASVCACVCARACVCVCACVHTDAECCGESPRQLAYALCIAILYKQVAVTVMQPELLHDIAYHVSITQT